MTRRKITLWLALVLSSNCDAAINNPKAPEQGRQIVCKNLDLKFLGVSRIEDLAIAAPHRGYVVGLTNLAVGHLLSAAKPFCWRYLLSQGTNGVGAAVLNADAKSGKARGFNSLEQSGFANETAEALRIAEQLPQIKRQDYEFRSLNIPAVSFVAAWLHGESDDIIIPLPPTFGRLNAYQPYSESQIISLLKASAETAMNWPKGTYEMVTNAFNRADWGALRRLAKPGMTANESIKLWESYERDGHPVHPGKLLNVEKNSQYYLDGKPCTTYSFELESKDGTPGVHQLQILVREENGNSKILDFWNFGW